MSVAPIFIFGLQRGGTNQLLNILRSHPDTTWPDGEFHEVLRPDKQTFRRDPFGTVNRSFAYLPSLIRYGDFVNPHRQFTGALQSRDLNWIKTRLNAETLKNMKEVQRYKSALFEHGLVAKRPAPSRMVVKVMNFNLVFADDLRNAFPDATFVGLIRDPVGIFESMTSRGSDPDKVLSLWKFFAERLLEFSHADDKIKVLRFEDLVKDVSGVAKNLFAFSDLEPNAVSGLCLQSKQRTYDPAGKVTGFDKSDAFYTFDAVQKHMRPDINENAKSKLAAAQLRIIEHLCGGLARQFEY